MPRIDEPLLNALGCALALALMLVLAQSGQMAFARVPFATSIVLVLCASDTEFAQPRNLVGGHLVATVCGLLVVTLAGHGIFSAALAVFVAVLVMQLTRTMHPPAGIDPVIVATEQVAWSFLLSPVGIGALILVGFTFVWRQRVMRKVWPLRWG